MPSLYAMYIKEREGSEIIEENYGFATYKIYQTECYVVDVFVVKEHRKSGKASQLVDMIKEKAKQAGCTHITTSVCLDANGLEESLNAIYNYGFKASRRIGNMIYFQMEIK